MIRPKYEFSKNSGNDEKIQYTYLMIDNANNAIKIGKSVNPLNREKTLQSEKISIEFIYYVESNIENELHKKFSNKRIRGEWFRLSNDELTNLIKDYNFKSAKTFYDFKNN